MSVTCRSSLTIMASAHTTREPAPPARARLANEARIVFEPVRMLVASPKIAMPVIRRSSTTTRRVMTIPGFGATDRSMSVLRTYLRGLGHEAIKWEQGRNNGEVQSMVDATLVRVDKLVAEDGPLDLIGWSLGGVVAREIARDRPDTIRSVITYGTPVVGGPRFTASAAAFGEERITDIESQIVDREEVPITVPITAIYSKNDGIVDWPACIDPYPNNVESVEVSSSHVGMGFDPDVWQLIANRLGQS